MNSSPGEQWWMAPGNWVQMWQDAERYSRRKQETTELHPVRKIETRISRGSMSSTVYSVTCLIVIKYPRKTILRKKGLLWLSFRRHAHHEKEGTVAETEGSWSYHVHSQKAEASECHTQLTLLFSFNPELQSMQLT